MILDKAHTSGAEEWACPACGRRFLVEWSPYCMIVVEPGDPSARHRGSQVDEATVAAYAEEEARLADDPRLATFEAWLDGIQLD